VIIPAHLNLPLIVKNRITGKSLPMAVINERNTQANKKKAGYVAKNILEKNRNEQGNLGILDASGKVIVPPGLKTIFLGWNAARTGSSPV
jgi:hypothetical protein